MLPHISPAENKMGGVTVVYENVPVGNPGRQDHVKIQKSKDLEQIHNLDPVFLGGRDAGEMKGSPLIHGGNGATKVEHPCRRCVDTRRRREAICSLASIRCKFEEAN